MDPLAAPAPPGNVPGGDTFMGMFTSTAERVRDWWSDKSTGEGSKCIGLIC